MNGSPPEQIDLTHELAPNENCTFQREFESGANTIRLLQ